MSGKLLRREDIEQTSQLKTEVVSVDEWGGAVLIRELTGSERDMFEASVVGNKSGPNRELNLKNLRAKLCALTMIDPDTKQRLYSDHEVGLLGAKSASALERVFQASRHLSGMTDEDVAELETELKNGQSDNSGFD